MIFANILGISICERSQSQGPPLPPVLISSHQGDPPSSPISANVIYERPPCIHASTHSCHDSMILWPWQPWQPWPLDLLTWHRWHPCRSLLNIFNHQESFQSSRNRPPDLSSPKVIDQKKWTIKGELLWVTLKFSKLCTYTTYIRDIRVDKVYMLYCTCFSCNGGSM